MRDKKEQKLKMMKPTAKSIEKVGRFLRKSLGSIKSTICFETGDESLINKNQHRKKKPKKKAAEPLEEAKRRGDMLAQKMKDFNMVDLRDVEHASDVQEALRCYSSIRSPVYLDIVDNFFTDMYYEFSDPLTTSSNKGSRRKAGSFRL
ncbi:hypothetical protein Bca52824_096333 [Brassica carinata]|uniref:Uncharacterized protein n=1 Tax=Brassica carinata TaxID=52824 RepID=A0A8X7NZP1_BRACI|nr:hypothetical protein Bca52824_096333 [Brassica carinata]